MTKDGKKEKKIKFTDEPTFDKSIPQNVTAYSGETVYLNCRVHQLANRTVSPKKNLEEKLHAGGSLFQFKKSLLLLENLENQILQWSFITHI